MTTADLSLRSGVRLHARSVEIDPDFDLLDAYAAGGFAWIAGDEGFVASGRAAALDPGDARAALAAIDHSCDGATPPGAGPRAVGALPFEVGGELVVPASIVGRDASGRAWRTIVEHADPGPRVESLAEQPAPSEFRVSAAQSRAEWHAMIDQALACIRRGVIDKVVLARAVRIEADRPFDLPAVLAYLRRSQPGCFVYADRGFVGASPELLVRKTGSSITSRPLAGTATDATSLVRSAKDAHEHRLVVDAVVEALGRHCTAVRTDGPHPLQLADVTHLATTVTARAGDVGLSVTDLVRTLHPTPAVGGTPRDAALEILRMLEPQARGRYAGPCGWVDRHGDGEFLVALRGGEIDGARAVVHAGAGIVAGSDPDAEWVETQQKLTPMLQALVRP